MITKHIRNSIFFLSFFLSFLITYVTVLDARLLFIEAVDHFPGRVRRCLGRIEHPSSRLARLSDHHRGLWLGASLPLPLVACRVVEAAFFSRDAAAAVVLGLGDLREDREKMSRVRLRPLRARLDAVAALRRDAVQQHVVGYRQPFRSVR